jgi:hypothetical protein
MRDSRDPAVSNDPRFALEVLNLMPSNLEKPSTFGSRPGFDRLLTSQLVVAGISYGTLGQLVHHQVSGGQHFILLAVGRAVLRYNCALDLATLAVSLTPNVGRMYGMSFGDTVVVHDGVATPVYGTTGSLANLSNAPIFYGQPVPYYAKLFAIKATERSTIVWSEEGDATIGYETGYRNRWRIGQTDQDWLYALASTNDELFYFRARSIGSVRGAVTPDFVTDGTHDGVSSELGTTSPDGVCLGPDDKVYFISADAEPCVIKGGKAYSMAENLHEFLPTIDRAQLDKAITRYDPTTGLVYFALVEIGQSQPSCVICVNPSADIPVAIWRGWTMSAMGIAKPGVGNATGTGAAPAVNGNTVEPTVPAMVHLSEDGYAYLHGTPNGVIWDDYHAAGVQPIAHAIESCHLVTDTDAEKTFHRTDILLRGEDEITVTVRHRTPAGTSPDCDATLVLPDSEAVWGSSGSDDDGFLWDEDDWAFGVQECRLAVGMKETGRWIRHRLEHEALGERFGFTTLSTQHGPAGNGARAA